MDSLTQIALGAAVGEVTLGSKVGNRALVWGGVAGTIPDLDILAYAFTDEITALAFHRGISHSLFFAFTAPLVLGAAVHYFYRSGFYQHKAYKAVVLTMTVLFISSFGLVPALATGAINWPSLSVSSILGISLGIVLIKNYYHPKLEEVNASGRDWSLLFFWAIFTHPLLDCCTAYGTQLFQPFSDFRVAWNNISVVDPIYTLPLLLGVIFASRLLKDHPIRRWINYGGLALSCTYLLFTVYNKTEVDRVFANSLKEKGIEYHRYMTAPTIFNNILWQGIAEGDSVYYHSFYSLLDKNPTIPHFREFPKNHHLLDAYKEDRPVEILKWFSNGYYNVKELESGQLQFNDLRYGTFGDSEEENYIFKFILTEKDGTLEATQTRDRDRASQAGFNELFNRIKGR